MAKKKDFTARVNSNMAALDERLERADEMEHAATAPAVSINEAEAVSASDGIDAAITADTEVKPEPAVTAHIDMTDELPQALPPSEAPVAATPEEKPKPRKPRADGQSQSKAKKTDGQQRGGIFNMPVIDIKNGERKSNQLLLLVQPSLHLKIKEWAKSKNISVNMLVRSILEQAVDINELAKKQSAEA